MITLTGTGPQVKTIFYTSALPAGFYNLGALLVSPTIDSAHNYALALYASQPPPQHERITSAAVGGSAKKSACSLENVYLEPGSTLSYLVNAGKEAPFTAPWTITLVINAGTDVS